MVTKVYDNYHGWNYAWGGIVFASMDNIKLYDTNVLSIGKRYPLTWGGELNATLFPPVSKFLVIALNASLSKGWNDNDLLNYKETSAATTTPSVIAFDKFDGKYGQLKTVVTKFRGAVSIPMAFWYFNPIPYAVLSANSGSKPTYFLGIYNNLLSKEIKFRAFEAPSSFGIGIDWSNKDNKWSKANVFVRGNISIGEF